MPEHGEEYLQYLKGKKDYEEAEKYFNDEHRRLKNYKQTVLLPAERWLRKLEKRLFKSKQINE